MLEWVEFVRATPRLIHGISFDAGIPSDWSKDQETELVFECCDRPPKYLVREAFNIWAGYNRRAWTGTVRLKDDKYDRIVLTIGLKGIPPAKRWKDVRQKIHDTARLVRTTVN